MQTQQYIRVRKSQNGHGTRVDLRGIHFLRVQGTAYERSRLHGELLRSEIHEGAMPFLSQKNESLIRTGPGLLRIPQVQDVIVNAYHWLLLGLMGRSTPPEVQDMIRGLMEGAGLSREAVIRSLFQADGLMMLSRVSVMKHVLKQIHLRGGISGCTSSVAFPEHTACGRMLAARNQDYPVVGPWEKHTLVLFQEPSERGKIPTVSVATAGVHTAGLTGMNREGLTLFTHAHFGRKVSLTGKTVVHLGNEILEEARTIGEAVDIARKNRRYANWAYVITSAKENQAVVLESTPDRVAVRPAEGGFLTHSNYFQSPEHEGQEALISGGVTEDLTARICVLQKYLRENRGKITPEQMATSLGDPTDPITGIERVVGNTVSVVTTIKSTVYDPLDQRFWVSTRGESPVGLDADYLEVCADPDRFWREIERGTWSERTIHGYRPKHAKFLEAAASYRRAYQAWHMDALNPNRAENALEEVKKVTSLYPEEGNAWVQQGLLEFVLLRFADSERTFRTALSTPLTPHIRGVAELFVARCLDLSGKRAKAKALYQSALERAFEPRLVEALQKGVKRPYSKRSLGDVQLDLQFPDTLHY